MTWRQAARAYIQRYQAQHMTPLSDAPPSLQLHYRILRKNGRAFRLARWGFYDPAKWSNSKTRS